VVVPDVLRDGRLHAAVEGQDVVSQRVVVPRRREDGVVAA